MRILDGHQNRKDASVRAFGLASPMHLRNVVDRFFDLLYKKMVIV